MELALIRLIRLEIALSTWFSGAPQAPRAARRCSSRPRGPKICAPRRCASLSGLCGCRWENIIYSDLTVRYLKLYKVYKCISIIVLL